MFCVFVFVLFCFVLFCFLFVLVLFVLFFIRLVLFCFVLFLFVLFFIRFHPIYHFRPSFLSPSYYLVAPQIRGHISRLFPLPPHYGSCLAFFLSREDLITLSSPVGSRRINIVLCNRIECSSILTKRVSTSERRRAGTGAAHFGQTLHQSS